MLVMLYRDELEGRTLEVIERETGEVETIRAGAESIYYSATLAAARNGITADEVVRRLLAGETVSTAAYDRKLV